MTRYRARTCPKCGYYLGYSVTKPLLRTREISVTSFCLNCSYKLPVHAVVQGGGRLASRFRRGCLQAAERAASGNGVKSDMPRNQAPRKAAAKTIRPEDYARHLRTIGQQLEKSRVVTFNLECTGTSYLLRLRAEHSNSPDCSSSHLLDGRPPAWLRIENQVRIPEEVGEQSRLGANLTPIIEFTPSDLDQLDEIRKNQRLHNGGFTDGHSLSQLLRTIGALVSQRNYHLIGISWRDLSIGIILETANGKREIDVYRPDNVYDLWVHMYLKRENRTLSDIPY